MTKYTHSRVYRTHRVMRRAVAQVDSYATAPCSGKTDQNTRRLPGDQKPERVAVPVSSFAGTALRSYWS